MSTDGWPMNELVEHGHNGILVPAAPKGRTPFPLVRARVRGVRRVRVRARVRRARVCACPDAFSGGMRGRACAVWRTGGPGRGGRAGRRIRRRRPRPSFLLRRAGDGTNAVHRLRRWADHCCAGRRCRAAAARAIPPSIPAMEPMLGPPSIPASRRGMPYVRETVPKHPGPGQPDGPGVCLVPKHKGHAWDTLVALLLQAWTTDTLVGSRRRVDRQIGGCLFHGTGIQQQPRTSAIGFVCGNIDARRPRTAADAAHAADARDTHDAVH